jgi:hypothetical protein
VVLGVNLHQDSEALTHVLRLPLLSATGVWGVIDEQDCASILHNGRVGAQFLCAGQSKKPAGELGSYCDTFAASVCARKALFNLILSLIFLYCETQATLLMTTTAIARPTMESMIMVCPPPD